MVMRIGIFDSGLGGDLVAARLKTLLPQYVYIAVHDRDHLPYGTRTLEDIVQLTDSAIQPLLQAGCSIIVLACNTATAAAIEELRTRYPNISFVGYEPMLKPAAKLTHAGVITILATPATLSSARYSNLKKQWAADIRVEEPDCSDWADTIERGRKPDSFDDVIDQINRSGSDIVILGCTHYLAMEHDIRQCTGSRVLEPTGSVARRIIELAEKKPPQRTARPYRRNS